MLHRFGRIAFGALMAGTLTATAGAQTASVRKNWDFLVTSGKLVSAGEQRAAVTSGDITTASLSRTVGASFALTASLGWARSRNLLSDDHRRLNVFMYDIGGEYRTSRRRVHGRISANASLGAGVGARSYDGHGVAPDARHKMAGYVSAGGEIGSQRVRVGVSVRNYVSGFEALDGSGSRRTRHDVVIVPGLRIVRK